MKPTFSGEMQLAGWSESHNGGCKVTFWLADPSDLEPFRAMTVRKGNQAGQRLMAALVEVGDDERPVQEPEKPKGGPLSELAGQWCRRDDFKQWIRPVYDRIMGGDGTGYGDVTPEDVGGEEKYAAHAICVICEINSRRELDHNAEAAALFHTLIREPYAKWQQERATA
jgi:hypothetical protein